MYDLVAVGESLIDFTPSGKNVQGISLYGCNPGGAPANVLAMAAKLGLSTAFIGMVGQDSFGDFLQSTMQDAGIATEGLLRHPSVHTTLAFVHLSPDGDRSFSFYRGPGADIMLRVEDLPENLIRQARVFHFGSVSLTDEPAREATFAAVRMAKEAGALISYDPNYRPKLWHNSQEAVKVMKQGLALADIVKVSDTEMEMLTDTASVREGLSRLREYGVTLALVTGGEKGAAYGNRAGMGVLPAFQVPVADTTGSGDAFLGALLSRLKGLDREKLETLSMESLRKAVCYANAAGGSTATDYGAIPAMPTHEEILRCMEQSPLRREDCFSIEAL